MLTFAALLLATAVAELPPSPPRVTLTPLPGGAAWTLAYDQRRTDLPAAKAEGLRPTLAEAKLDELLAAHLRLRTAATAADAAATRTAEETRTAQREKERLDRQQREVDNLEKQAETAKANFNRWRNRDEKQAAQFQASYQSLNARAANERKQLARAKENQARAAADKAEAAQAEEAAEQAWQAAKEAYAKAAAKAAPALNKLRGVAGVPEPR
jgi:chromosome segregation ATPase